MRKWRQRRKEESMEKGRGGNVNDRTNRVRMRIETNNGRKEIFEYRMINGGQEVTEK